MRRTPIAHLVFPRPNLLRPVSEFAWDAAAVMAAERGFDLEVLMPVPVEAARRLASLSRGLRGATPWPEGFDARLVELEPKPTLVPYLPLPRRSIEAATAAVSALLVARRRAQRPAVLHGSFLDEGGFVAAMAARAIGASSIAVAHGTDVEMARSVAGGDGGRRRRALATLKHASEIIAVSQHLAGQVALLGRTAEIIRFTVRPERFAVTRPPAGSPELLFVGRLSKAKGVDVLLEALPRLARRDARLSLIGAATGELDVAEEARRLEITDRVQILGELAHEALPAHYQRCSLLVLPSRREGFGNVMVEALLSGRPVVATDSGGPAELITPHNGRLVPPGDPAALARAIDEVLARRDAFQPEALRSSAEPFTWKEMAPKLARLTWRRAEASAE
ncbi:MAG: glycosyltransferase [Deltaproteobacteria bacterium]|nr:glycosyltransferase [Deltaproteobacteria bacterium]